MGRMLFIGSDLRVASSVTFIPGAEMKRNHAIVTVINNRGKNSNTQEEMTDEVTLNFWGKYAGVASHYLYPGKQINCEGRLQSYTEDLGQVTAGGKRKLNRKIEIVVTNMQLLGDSMKNLNERFINKITELKNAGRLPMEVALTAKELLNTTREPLTDFNMALASQTGKYGQARVWSKDKGFWDQNLSMAVNTNPNPQVVNPQNSTLDLTSPSAIAAHITSLQQLLNNTVTTPAKQTEQSVAASPDPFA